MRENALEIFAAIRLKFFAQNPRFRRAGDTDHVQFVHAVHRKLKPGVAVGIFAAQVRNHAELQRAQRIVASLFQRGLFLRKLLSPLIIFGLHSLLNVAHDHQLIVRETARKP